ncbi:MAG: DUF4830 domain-containing protein [Ruthenibacterium sp.]
MFVFTFRKGGLRRLAAVCLCGAAIVGAAAAGIAWNRAQSTPANAAAAGLTQQITGSQDLAAFLAGYGVEVDPTSAEVMAVKVPRKWDESFEAFHAVVQQSGLSLEKCKGKQVDKWTVPVPAMCDDAKKTYAVVLVYKNEPKGAYLLEKPSGEVKPLVSSQSGTALTDQEKAAAAGFGAGSTAQSTPPAASAGADTQQPASQVNTDTQQPASEVTAQQPEEQQAADVLAQDAGAWPTE